MTEHPIAADPASGEGESLPPELTAAIRSLAAAPRLLVALDFDGTLAPTVDEPSMARALPAARSAVLALLDLPNTRVALVSGRALASLEEVADMPDTVLLAGSHGAEFRLDGAESWPDLDEDARVRLDRMRDALFGVALRHEHVRVEQKPAGYALHTRLAGASDAAAAQAEAVQLVAGIDGVTALNGKDVIEFSVLSVTKGDAVVRLRKHAQASAVLFAGDDVTDEFGFAALVSGDVGVKVGQGETRAAYRVLHPAAMVPLLALIAESRADGVALVP